MKVCKDCLIKKELDEFHRHPQMADGHINSCKACKKLYGQIHRLTYQRPPADPIKNRARVKKWISENMDRHSKRSGEWAKRNPDKRREYAARYRARKLDNIHVPYDRRELIERDNSTCYLCGEYTATPQLDHVIPVSKGGADAEWNLRVACPSCNRKKSNKFDYAD